MNEYEAVPVVEAKILAEKYKKSIVIINAWDAEHGLLHTTTFGVSGQDKQWAADGGEIAAKALGAELTQKQNFEDFRVCPLHNKHKLFCVDCATGLEDESRSEERALGWNYVANKEVEPTEIRFANGTVVRCIDGHLDIERGVKV